MTVDNIDHAGGGHGSETESGEPQRLQGNMGVGELVMSVLAFSSPLTTVAGFIPVLLAFSGNAAPAIYLVVTALLLLFSVGFTAMGRVLANPGGFYAFVTAGLGRPAGLGGAFLATFGYALIGLFAPPLFALTAQSFVQDNLGGPAIAWYWYALAIVAVTTFLAYRRIDLSAKVLTTVMVLEVIAVIVFNVLSFSNGGPADGGGATLSMPWITDASIGLAVLFVAGNFFGFEATVIYREEVKDPERTIPRATYLAVGGIGVFYAVAAWAYLAFFGSDKAQAAAEANTGGLFTAAISDLMGDTLVDVVTVLLLTSILASMLSIQNVSARYLYSLGTDGVLPTGLGKVHRRHGSPFVSASIVGLFWAAVLSFFAIIGTAPDSLYAKASGSGSLAVTLLLFAASVAVVVYFARNREGGSVWKTQVAPALAAVGLGVVAYLALTNFPDLIGTAGPAATILLTLTFGLFAAGFLLALALRRSKPEVYARIGRQQL